MKPNKKEYEGRAIFPWHFLVILLLSFVALIMLYGLISSESYTGYLTVMFLGSGVLAIMGWLNFLFRKVVVDKDGIVYKKTLNLKLILLYDWFYPFESMEKIEVRKNLVRIKYKQKTPNPSLFIVENPDGFVRAVRRYAPELINRGV